MAKDIAYFFAEYPIEFTMWAGLADTIKEVRPELQLVLVHVGEPKSQGYDWRPILDRFDHVHRVGRVTYVGGWEPYGVYTTLTRGFPGARRATSELQNIELKPNSVAFVYNGTTLNQSIFLKRAQAEAQVDSVLLTEHTDDLLIDDFVLSYGQSLFFNLYLHFFGPAYVDLYRLRTLDGARTRQRELRFRDKPADFVFAGEYPHRNPSLRPGQVYLPFSPRNGRRAATAESVALFGDIFEWEPYLSVEACYRRYNEIIDLIRQKHPGARLIYKPHPGEGDRERAKLDLTGFETVSGISSEILVMRDPSISTAYSFTSTSVFTAAGLGVQSYFLYPLFGEDCIPEALRRRYERRWHSRAHPEMCIRSVEEWMSCNYDYEPKNMSNHVRSSTLQMLQLVGIAESSKECESEPHIGVTPETRWAARRPAPPLRHILWRSLWFLPRMAWLLARRSLKSIGRR